MLDFIINPTAGGINGKKINKTLDIIKSVLEKRQVEYKFHISTSQKNTRALTSALIDKGAKNIIAVGGDGTIHDVVNGLKNFEDVTFGIIPCGTGNDFASAINLPLNVEKAVEIILDCPPKFTDYMQMPTVRGINIIGMGIDVDVLKKYQKCKKKNKLAYTTSLIKTLFSFDYINFDVIVDGDTQPKNYTSFIACIANGNRYGGGIPICPPANPTDQKLDFVAVKNMPKLKIISAFLKLKKGKLLSLKEATHYNMQKITVIPKGDYTVNVDGELYDNIPFTVEIVSNKLKMFRP